MLYLYQAKGGARGEYSAWCVGLGAWSSLLLTNRHVIVTSVEGPLLLTAGPVEEGLVGTTTGWSHPNMGVNVEVGHGHGHGNDRHRHRSGHDLDRGC